MISIKTLIKTFSIVTLLSIITANLYAEETIELSDIQKIETRQEIMKGYKAWDKKLSNAYKQEIIDTQTITEAVLFFKDNSGDELLALFSKMDSPEGVKTKAKSAIWRSFDTFSAITLDVNKAANEAYTLIEQGDFAATKEAMNPIINSCRSCHKKYKAR
ncbi:MAG: cytochrome c [Saccharospirillaceae bacterium]|nr:cytochrome c [Pseudomonadales bacterium]NRB78448.1 cytochrome c [Saccharospirillaceae bacterium]